MIIGHFPLNICFQFLLVDCGDCVKMVTLNRICSTVYLDILFCFHFNWKGVRHPVMTVPILDLAGRMINLLLITKSSIGAATCLYNAAYNAVSYRTRNAKISQLQRRP